MRKDISKVGRSRPHCDAIKKGGGVSFGLRPNFTPLALASTGPAP
jgi:hypothetical protein